MFFLVLIGSSVCMLFAFGFRFVRSKVDVARNPHKDIYHRVSDQTVVNRSSIVYPLIDKEQTFDIAATVWIRGTELEEQKLQETFLVSVEGGDEGAIEKHQLLEQDKTWLYTPLYSDIIFRGLRSHHKHVSATVNFSLPTRRLYVFESCLCTLSLTSMTSQFGTQSHNFRFSWNIHPDTNRSFASPISHKTHILDP